MGLVGTSAIVMAGVAAMSACAVAFRRHAAREWLPDRWVARLLTEYGVRFREPEGGASLTDRTPVLTYIARAVRVYALSEAQFLGLPQPGTEQLLAALIREDNCLGMQILRELGVPPRDVLRALAKNTGQRGASGSVRRISAAPVELTDGGAYRSSGHVLATDAPPETDTAEEAITIATAEAAAEGSRFVTTSHLLLGLLLTGATTASAVLARQGLTAEKVRAISRRREYQGER